jgi:hypothetical protein
MINDQDPREKKVKWGKGKGESNEINDQGSKKKRQKGKGITE